MRRRAAGDELVRRAAATGSRGGPTDAERQSQRRFLTLVAAVVIAGSAVVGFSWATRQYHHPTVLDSWQNAYAVFDCRSEAWLPPLEPVPTSTGIRSRGDGLIYIEPAEDAYAGDNATLGLFLNEAGARLTDDELTLPDGTLETIHSENSS